MGQWPGNEAVIHVRRCTLCDVYSSLQLEKWVLDSGKEAATHTHTRTHACTHTCTHTHTHAHTQIQSKIKQASTTFHLQRNTNNSILSNLFQRLCHAAMCEEIIVGTQYSNNLIRSQLQTASCRQLHDQYIVLPCTHTHSNNVSLTVLWHAYTVWIHSAYCYERPTWAHTLICVCTYTM